MGAGHRIRTAGKLASAVVDREVIDWSRVAYRPSTRAAAAVLRSLESIAAFCTPGASAHDVVRAGASPQRTARWLWAVGALASVQTAIGIVGYLLGIDVETPVPVLVPLLTVAAFSGAAIWLLFAGRADKRAVSLGTFFLLVASAFAVRFAGFPTRPGLSLFLRGVHPDVFLPACLWDFVRRFPRIVRFSWTDSACRLGLAISLSAGCALFAANIVHEYGGMSLLRPFVRAHGLIYWAAVLGLTAATVPVILGRFRAAPPGEQRRVRLFGVAVAATLAPLVAEILVEIAFPRLNAAMNRPGARALLAPVVFGPLLSLPLVTAYAVLADRVLDVRTAIGTTLRYLFARLGVGLMVVVPLAVLALQGYQHQDLSLRELLAGPQGTALVLWAVGGMILGMLRRPIVAAVDRRFFRVPTNLAEALPSLAETLATARGAREVARAVEEQLERVLQTTASRVFLRDAQGRQFIAQGAPPASLSGQTCLASLLGADGSPLSLDSRPTSFRWLLPVEERAWLDALDLSLLAPLRDPVGGVHGFIALGHKRSEADFTKDEISFVASAAATMAITLGARRMSAGSDAADEEPAAECSSCGIVSAPDEAACACAAPLRIASVPSVLRGQFRVSRRLGAGGMGVVYRGEDLALGRSVALKTLPRLSPDAIQRLSKEARVMAPFVHPHLATIFGIEHWHGTPILIVELLEAGTLADRLARGPLDVRSVLAMGHSLAQGLDRLHAAGVLHRDVKPSNIGFTADGTVKLLDFGVASLSAVPDVLAIEGEGEGAARRTQTLSVNGHEMVGTPLYQSPEAVRGSSANPQSDLWALCLVLYESITGLNPFRDTSVDAVLDRITRTPVPDIRTLRPDCPVHVAEAFAEWLAEAPRKRPQSAQVLSEHLTRAIGQFV